MITTPRNLCWAVVWLLIWAGAAFARQGAQPDEGGDTSAPEGASAAPADDTGNGELDLSIRRIGVGDRIRPGDWAGFQLEIKENSPKARTVLVQMDLPDPDGDQALTTRVISTTPGQARSVWLYGWQPRDGLTGFTYRVSAYEARLREGVEAGAGIDKYIKGRRLAVRSLQASPRIGIDGSSSLIGVVGLTTGGLEQYPACRESRNPVPPTGHEITELAAGLRPGDLPDMWQGLMSMEALVWTGNGAEFDSAKLTFEQAQAIREWVKRGGHLIIALPSVGQTWYGASATLNPLADIMPLAEPKLMEGLDLNDYRMLFTFSKTVSLGTRKDAAMWRMDKAQGAGPFDCMTVLAGPVVDDARGGEGQRHAFVVRRLVGEGAVTVMGMDPSRRELAPKDALRADVFWNRILGKRLQLLSQNELSAAWTGATKKKGQQSQPKWLAQRQPVEFDAGISEQINKSVSAVKGLLLAFVVFTLYWLLAGPVGYFVLKQRGLRQHAWVAFLAIAGVFTFIGWSGASVLRMSRDADKHLTFIDHVYGQGNTRVRSWMELTLPKYGEQRLSVAGPVDASGSPSEWHNTITAWQPQGNQNLLGSFPDARGYLVDAKFPSTTSFPARATTRQFQVDYAGGLPANWGMIHPVAGEGVALGKEVWIEYGRAENQAATSGSRNWKIHGTLVHSLPGDLKEVIVIVITEAKGRWNPGQLPANAYAVLRNGFVWKPGTPTDLEADWFEGAASGKLDIGGLLTTWRGEDDTRAAQLGTTGFLNQNRSFEQAMYALACYPMLPGPIDSASNAFRAVRESAQTWDLGRWFTQPCVIVIGILGEKKAENAVECAVPVSIDSAPGENVRKQIKGTTVVRWVYPLGERPPAWVSIPFDAGADDREEDKKKDDLPDADGRG